MKAYFYSLIPCQMKINGRYCGEVGTETISHEINKGDLIEFVSPEFIPISCLFDQGSEFISVFKKGDFCLVFPHGFSHYPFAFEKKYSADFFSGNANLTVFTDQSAKILIQTQSDLAIFEYPFYPTDIEVIYAENQRIALFLNKKTVYLFELSDKINIVYTLSATQYLTAEKGVVLKRNPPTLLRHDITYTLCPPNFEVVPKVVRNRQNDFGEELKKIAFLQCLAVGDDVSDFLPPDLNSPQMLSGFLGKFIAVLPPPHDGYDFTLLYSDGVKFISLKTAGGLITDIILD